jgi:hypothetical protein
MTLSLYRFIALAFVFLSCTESVLDVDNSIVEDQQLPEGVKILPAVEPAANLSDLGITFSNGIPEYRDVQHLRQMFKTVQHASVGEYMEWAESHNFVSPYRLYNEALQRMESLDDERELFSNADLTSSERKALFVDEEGSIDIRIKALAPAMIMSADGKFFVANSLNQWDVDHHFVIPNRNFELLEAARLNPTNPKDGSYYVQDIVYGDDMFASGERGLDKVQRANIQCPAPLPLSPSDANRFGVISVRQLVDERSLDVRQRMTSNILMTNGVFDLDPNFPDDTKIAINLFSVDYKNERKRPIGWIGTQPNVQFQQRVDNGPANSGGSIADPLRFSRFLFRIRFDGTLDQVYNIANVLATESSTTQLTQIREGSQSGVGVFDDSGVEFEQLLPAAIIGYSHQNGTARVIWINRGNDVTNDPISNEFNCQ